MVTYYRRSSDRASLSALVVVAFVLLVLSNVFYPYFTKSAENVVVTGTVVKNYEKDSKYLIFTDHGVFENTDSLSYFKWNSSDLQNQLMQPGRYQIEYYGWRIPFFSTYPNIISAKRIQ